MKILSYILSPIFVLVFFLLLLVFHPLQWIGLQFHQKYQQIAVEWLNFWICKSLLILGVPVRFKNKHELPKNQTLIFVSNHQSMFDIPPVIWYLRKHCPKFVSKIELGKGIPSISFNLRHGGAALINRKDSKQAITELIKYAKRINENKWSSVIFPEGTRSRDGKPKKFAVNGLKTIIKFNPDAYIVPITVNNSWKIFKYGKFPLGIGAPLEVKVHQPLKISEFEFPILMEKVEEVITTNIQ